MLDLSSNSNPGGGGAGGESHSWFEGSGGSSGYDGACAIYY